MMNEDGEDCDLTILIHRNLYRSKFQKRMADILWTVGSQLLVVVKVFQEFHKTSRYIHWDISNESRSANKG